MCGMCIFPCSNAVSKHFRTLTNLFQECAKLNVHKSLSRPSNINKYLVYESREICNDFTKSSAALFTQNIRIANATDSHSSFKFIYLCIKFIL